ncbi:MAG: TetR/AcrR family transcriptional regulator [Bacillota bacterium]
MELKNSLFEGMEKKKKKICEAAINIFQEQNFTETTVSEIASAAHVGKGTFYLYFESKISLLDFLLEIGIKKLIDYVKKCVENIKNPKEKLEKLIDSQLDFHNYYKNYFYFFLREMWAHREGLREKINVIKEEYISIIESIIEAGKKKGFFKDVNSDTISSALFGMLTMPSFHWAVFYRSYPKEEINKDLSEVFFNGLLK